MAMERTRIAKVEDVTLARRGDQVVGTLHLTPHHVIFVHTPVTGDTNPLRPKELWITYPIISFCTLRPAPAASRQPSSIRLRCRDFTFVCFYFLAESKARDVYDSIKAWTCKLGRIEKLYAFTYQPQPPEKEVDCWGLYDPVKEWRRMGVGDPSRKTHWRISNINQDYSFSPTYPSLLAVPSAISDNTLNYASRYRSRARVPVLTYLHPVNDCSITRSSQPLVGVRSNRSIQDEKLLAAIFSTTRNERPLAHVLASPALERDASGSSKADASLTSTEGHAHRSSSEAVEDEMIAKLRGDDDNASGTEADEAAKPMVYGAQQRNMIVDARPSVNAYAMQAVGLGTENMDNYKFATKAYLGIDNIHVMRDSLEKVISALKDGDIAPLGPNRDLLAKSGWLKHISNLLDGAALIVRQVGVQHSHVLVHCSDGWDRTSQLSALSQLCLDPYYRTLEGFMVLVEKDWLSFGHMFRHRSGFLSSEKWFQIENERIGGRETSSHADGGVGGKAETLSGAQKTFESALRGAKGFFNRADPANASRESLGTFDSDSEQGVRSYDSDNNPSPSAPRRTHPPSSSSSPAPSALPTVPPPNKKKPEPETTKVKETSPIFHQFLDAVYQLQFQHPTRFEFNERFLRRLLYHLYSCQYGSFLFDSERARVEARLRERTRCVWDYFLARREGFVNKGYDGVVDDMVRGRERLVFPRGGEVRWWAGVFGRGDEEMNFGIGAARAREGRPLRGYKGKVGGVAEEDADAAAAGLGKGEGEGEGEGEEEDSNLPGRATASVLVGVETAAERVGAVALTADGDGQSAAESTGAVAGERGSGVREGGGGGEGGEEGVRDGGSVDESRASPDHGIDAPPPAELAKRDDGNGPAVVVVVPSPPQPAASLQAVSSSATDEKEEAFLAPSAAVTEPVAAPLVDPMAAPFPLSIRHGSSEEERDPVGGDDVPGLDIDPLGVGALVNGSSEKKRGRGRG